jgi:V8-like Glu-specific endopeptidase
MKKLLLLGLLLGSCAADKPTNYLYIENPTNVRHLQQSVVAIMHWNALTEQLEGPKCTAFFVAPTLIATAHHCIAPPTEQSFEIVPGVEIKIPLPPEPTIGRTIPIMTRNQFIEFANTDGVFVSSYDATVVGFNEEHDVALLKIGSGVAAEQLSMTSFEARVGETVYTMGMPRHQPWILTQGIISSMHPNGVNSGNILHQANIAPGASGSPLIDNFGQVIAINVGYIAETSYLGVAVPIRHLQTLIMAYQSTSTQ